MLAYFARLSYGRTMEIARNAYERDDRSDSFRMIGDVIATIAEHKGIHIDDTTRERWSDLLGLLREFDTLVDDQGMPASEALSELLDFSRFKQNYPSLGPPEICQETHEKMVLRVKRILEHGDEIRETTDIDTFVTHRYEEVDHTAELLADCATSEVTTQAGFYTRFMPALRGMGEAANFIDTFIDHRRDQKEQKVSIKGSPQFYGTIGKIALREFGRVSHVLSDYRVIAQFYRMSVMRLQNRIAHGKKPYSSLNSLH